MLGYNSESSEKEVIGLVEYWQPFITHQLPYAKTGISHTPAVHIYGVTNLMHRMLCNNPLPPPWGGDG